MTEKVQKRKATVRAIILSVMAWSIIFSVELAFHFWLNWWQSLLSGVIVGAAIGGHDIWQTERRRRRYQQCLRSIDELERALRIGTPEQIAQWDAYDAQLARWASAMSFMTGVQQWKRIVNGDDDGEQ